MTKPSCARLPAAFTGNRQPMHLIAGATGYIGGLLADRLAADQRPVRCLARTLERARSELHGRCEIVRGDVLDGATLGPAVAEIF
jgi:UDP-glucose 4-epimerase